MDWSELPHDLLGSILERLPVADHHRCGLVCSSWRSATKSNLFAPAAQSPWLMLPFNPRATSPSAKSSAQFYSLSERKVYRIPLPDPPVSDRLCIGSSHGWLIAADETSELHLLNPITRAQLPLPSITTFPFVEALRDRKGHITSYNLYLGGDDDDFAPESFAPDQLRYFFYEKAVVSSDHTVMLIHNPLFKLAFARPGDEEWTMVDTPSSYWVDAIFSSSGQCCTLESTGRVEAWDLHGPLPTSAIVAPSLGYSDCSKYLVELPAGQLLQVRRWRDPLRLGCSWEPRPLYVEHTTTRVEVFELRLGRNGWAWVREQKEGLTGFALFLGKNGSLCVSTRECPELKGNCVYLTDDGTWSFERCHNVVPDVGMFDLSDGRLKPCGGYDFQWIWPPPIWVTPTM
uniref:F-box protein At5g55150 n=1 Tax=Elaeis guineensis var. tenera TaxID=51953 RepID=A0A6I9SB00_ELAGV|nr:putative F-box protein At5g55150 [Elaeis guineensis]